ncbi:hypothetical protein AMRN_0761 [Malaciobacter marinus]|uniref:Uncharacterized protein n=2 Tax=Arcobacteraceae TaxID=2808963 RepID=A0A347TIT7_9BACT|nr:MULTISPECIES: hypothetical protein [Arcobacteraceae]AXX86515.1 hypothetical protein AMRN_0761 [Malaciobacter marinus]PHO14093.1 hypothetical protein CPH92_13735 [Malaciobacter marinus]RXK11672.1 hypothetical protein CP965_12950 [Halarcobacter mediterraneus]
MKKYEYKIIATRQLTGYAGKDKYINVYRFPIFKEFYDLKKTHSYDTVKIEIVDYILGSFEVDLKQQHKQPEFWLKNLGKYIIRTNMQPGDIVTLTILIDGSNNYSFFIKSDRYFKYLLERHNTEINKYRLLIENPNKNTSESITNNTENFLYKFDVYKSDSELKFSNEVKDFTVWEYNGNGGKYLGIPFHIDKVEEFNELEEIL